MGDGTSRREWFAKVVMAAGLLLGYGAFAIQGFLFILPEKLKPKTRLLFAGLIDQFKIGDVQTFLDLEGNDILIKRNPSGFEAFSSTCPHLGCRVHWISDEKQFFCPCHRGVFDSDGVGILGPPLGQQLYSVPLVVDESSGVVYIEVKDRKHRRA